MLRYENKPVDKLALETTTLPPASSLVLLPVSYSINTIWEKFLNSSNLVWIILFSIWPAEWFRMTNKRWTYLSHNGNNIYIYMFFEIIHYQNIGTQQNMTSLVWCSWRLSHLIDSFPLTLEILMAHTDVIFKR